MKSKYRLLLSYIVHLASVFFLLVFSLPSFGASTISESFDHLATGFQLDGAHEKLDCEKCHIGAVFDALPLDCKSCHDEVFALGKTPTHIVTEEPCGICHNTTDFALTARALFDHSLAGSATCQSCHNGISARGKSPTHIHTSDNCAACHINSDWFSINFAHSEVDATTCAKAGCHSSSDKGQNHILTTDRCEACHGANDPWAPVAPGHVDHNEVIGTCISCHDGVTASGKTSAHMPTTDLCDACHETGAAWTPLKGRVDHRQVIGACESCHDHVIAVGVGPNHIPITESCKVCHSVQNWLVENFDHSRIDTTSCETCHDGVIATGKRPNHVPTTEKCDTCHDTTTWLGAKFDHANIGGQACVSCHNNVIASGKSSVHIPTTDKCEACHSYAAPWFPVASDNVDHNEVIGKCIMCHDGTIASGKGPTHIATSDACETCHGNPPALWITPIAPGAVDHTQVIGVCSSCHDGTIAKGMGLSHVPITQECNACHETTQWLGATVDHSGIIDNCISCHDGIKARGKNPATHIVTSLECNECHSTENWLAAVPDHSGFNNNQCADAGCHDGVATRGKSPTHLNTTDVCGACHAVFPSFWTPVASIEVDHFNVIGTCAACHDGIIAIGQSALHISTTPNCEACHQPSPTPWLPLLPSLVDHNEILTVTICTGCHTKGIHPLTTELCANCHLTPPPFTWADFTSIPAVHDDALGVCSNCHGGSNPVATIKTPLHIPTNFECDACHNTFGWLGATFDHGAVIGQVCISCHDGVIASGKETGHINTTDLCDACHEVGPTPWRPVIPSNVDHSQVIGLCSSCHDAVIASGKGANHINSTDLCDACHSAGPIPWRPVAPSNVDHGQVIGLCSSCHDGIIAIGKDVNHVPTQDECDVCHVTTQWLGATVDHTNIIGNCVSCHDSVIASGKTAQHPTTSVVCEQCHVVILWLDRARFIDHSQALGRCDECHGTGIATTGPGNNHNMNCRNYINFDCVQCHNTSSWLNANRSSCTIGGGGMG